jgi:hypothetical protein
VRVHTPWLSPGCRSVKTCFFILFRLLLEPTPSNQKRTSDLSTTVHQVQLPPVTPEHHGRPAPSPEVTHSITTGPLERSSCRIHLRGRCRDEGTDVASTPAGSPHLDTVFPSLEEEAKKKTPRVSCSPAAQHAQLQDGAEPVDQRETSPSTTTSASPPHQHQQESRQLPSLSPVAVRPDSQPRHAHLGIGESPDHRRDAWLPQPARRRRIREDATVPQPSAIPTRTSPGRLSPRAPTASPDSTSVRRSQRLEPKRPRTSTST